MDWNINLEIWNLLRLIFTTSFSTFQFQKKTRHLRDSSSTSRGGHWSRLALSGFGFLGFLRQNLGIVQSFLFLPLFFRHQPSLLAVVIIVSILYIKRTLSTPIKALATWSAMGARQCPAISSSVSWTIFCKYIFLDKKHCHKKTLSHSCNICCNSETVFHKKQFPSEA